MEQPPLRMTLATQLVLRAMLVEPTHEAYGAEISRAAGLPSGTITPIVARLENAGILTHRVEDVDPAQAGRPRRKYYSFTPDGAERARDALARTTAATPSRVSNLRPGLAGGLA
jgi:PadR family transcriptional regulator, regulatory protein PadR